MIRLLFAALAVALTLVSISAAEARPARDIAAVALHPWRMETAAQKDQVFAGIQAAGVRWARVDLRWNLVEHRRDALRNGMADWREMDAIVAAADRHGVKLLPIVAYVPSWASPEGDTWAFPDQAPFEDFFAAALRRYPQVPAWELWNEPNFGRFSKPVPDPAGFVEFLRTARAVRDAAGSSAKLIAGGLAPGTEIDIIPWIDQVAGLGGLELVDGLGVHPYSPREPDDPGSWLMRLHDLHQQVADLGRPDLPLWLTEYGAPAASMASAFAPALSEDEQAERLRLAFALATRLPYVENLTWYEYRDSCSDGTHGECRFGLVREDMSPRPAYHALSDVVGGATTRLRPRLRLASRVGRAGRVEVLSARLAHSRAVLRRVRPPSARVRVTGSLLLPGSAKSTGRVILRVLRRGKRPYKVAVRVSDGAFSTRLRPSGTSRLTIEARYAGSSAYEPVRARGRVSAVERLVSSPARR